MADMMTFPNTWEEFEECYGITDREEIYTNGARLIPSFRVGQWLDHIADRKTEPQTEPKRKKGEWINDKGLYKCSCCNHLWAEWWAIAKPIEQMNKEMLYCPNCGARMEGLSELE